jgi:hypothetical protein
MATHSVVYNEKQLKELAKKDLPKGVSWIRSFCGFDDKKTFCEWQAPSREAVEQVFRTANIPFDAIYKVRLFDVRTATLEP